MNRAVTIAFKNGEPTILTGPEVPVRDQQLAFKQLVQDGVEGFDTLELWTSSLGRVKRKPLKPRPAAPAKQAKKAEAAPAAETNTETAAPAKQAKKGK